VKDEKQVKVEHGSAKCNWADGHGIGLVVTEGIVKPKIISQERLGTGITNSIYRR
jgi:hypothetical protein